MEGDTERKREETVSNMETSRNRKEEVEKRKAR
jgi:hypothetical protein